MFRATSFSVLSRCLLIMATAGMVVGCAASKRLVGAPSIDLQKGKTIDQIKDIKARCDEPDELEKNHWSALNDPASFGLLRNRDVESYSAGILRKLVNGWGGKAPGLKIYVDGSPRFNAQAYPGCAIYVTAGTLERARNEGEVAAILAHELAHVVLNHNASSTVQSAVRWMTGAAPIAEVIANATFTGGDLHLPSDGGQIGQASEAAGGFTQTFVMPTWTSAQEEEADQLGVDFLARAGYDPNDMHQMMNWLKDTDAQAGADDWITAGSVAGTGNAGGGAATGVAVGTTVLKGVAGSWLKDQSKDHLDTKVRIDNVEKYLKREYGGPAQPVTYADGLPAFRSQPAAAQLFAGRKLARNCWKTERLNSRSGASKPAGNKKRRGKAPAVSAPTESAVSLSQSAGSVTFYEFIKMEGCTNPEAPKQNPALVTQFINDGLSPVPWRLGQVDRLIADQRADEALAVLQLMENEFGMQDNFYGLKIKALDAAGKKPEAQALKLTCQARMVALAKKNPKGAPGMCGPE